MSVSDTAVSPALKLHFRRRKGPRWLLQYQTGTVIGAMQGTKAPLVNYSAETELLSDAPLSVKLRAANMIPDLLRAMAEAHQTAIRNLTPAIETMRGFVKEKPSTEKESA